MIMFHSLVENDLLPYAFLINCKSTLCIIVLLWECFILVTAGKISVAMDTTEELFRTDEEHR